VLKTWVSAANVDDRVGATLLLHDIRQDFPRLRHCWADQGYRGPFLEWARRVAGITVQVAARRDGGMRGTWALVGAPPRIVPRFAVVPCRWVVERTYAWLGRYRRLAKDADLAAVIPLACIRCENSSRSWLPLLARVMSSEFVASSTTVFGAIDGLAACA
jgi:transposase